MLDRKKSTGTFSTDRVVQNVWRTLLRDFRGTSSGDFCKEAEAAFDGGIKSFRAYEWPVLGFIPPSRYKRYAQLSSLVKKYRFAEDVYTDQELESLTLQKYFGEQERLGVQRPLKALGLLVAQRARCIARRILGPLDPDGIITMAKFGKRSSIGCPLSLAYIDEKLTNVKAFTGSKQCSRWFFDRVLPQDEILSQMVHALPSGNAEDLEHESLNLVNVPKNWKTYRTITPLTLLSLFYSYGVGQQVTDRLAEAGLDIRRLQNRHRMLVKKFSVSLTHATADLSAASDSLTSESLNRILPREWYCALKKAITHQVIVKTPDGNRSFYTSSVLPMGNGFTFPVETLIFYCIIKAIGELTGVEGVFSVYGDDLIYPSRLHKFVVGIFPMFNLVLNADKTFVKAPFRESCGSDYYRGVDVRPFFFQGECQRLTASQYLAFLYKTYNGLTRRWDPWEIRSTLYYLLQEIAQVAQVIFRIPVSYPDTAGIKVDYPGLIPLGCEALPWSPINVLFTHGSRWFKFGFLMSVPHNRFVKTVLPYYWLSLQGLTDDPDVRKNFWDRDHSYMSEKPRQSLIWEKLRVDRIYMRRGVRVHKKVVKYSACVATRSGMRYTNKFTKTGSISDWI